MNPTASSIFRAAHCQGSCALVQVHSSSEASAKGRNGHRFLELVPKLGAEKALDQVPADHREFCERIELDGLPLGPEYRQEMAFAFDASTGKARVLGQGLDREYPPLAPTEIAGTLDVIGLVDGSDGQREYIIEDYKFDGYESHSPAPDENPQLFFGALCLSRLSSVERFRVALRHFRPDGSHWREEAEIDALDLDSFALKLRQLLDRIHAAEDTVFAGKTPEVSRGAWCRFCPAVTSCPPILAMVRAAAVDPRVPAGELQAMMTAAGQGDITARTRAAGMAYARLKEIEDALKPWKSALYLFASETPIPLEDGRIYGMVQRPVDELDARKARQVLAQLYSPDVAEAACEFETSKAAIERAVKPIWIRQVKDWQEQKASVSASALKVKKPTLTALKDAALAALDKAGGVKSKLKRQVRLHRMSTNGEAVTEASGPDEEVF